MSDCVFTPLTSRGRNWIRLLRGFLSISADPRKARPPDPKHDIGGRDRKKNPQRALLSKPARDRIGVQVTRNRAGASLGFVLYGGQNLKAAREHKSPCCELYPSPAGVVKCAVRGNRQHARDERERERREKNPRRDCCYRAARQGVASKGSRRRRKAHEDEQGRDGPHEPGGSDRVEKFEEPSQGVSNVASSMCQIYRGLRNGGSGIVAASRVPTRL